MIKHYYAKNGQLRPDCLNLGCSNPVQEIKRNKKNKIRKWRWSCSSCHNKGIQTAKKDYCENRDGRLGFYCSSHIVDKSQLQIDHKNGDSSLNTPENTQTLCANCHTVKSKRNKDNNKQNDVNRKGGTSDETFKKLFFRDEKELTKEKQYRTLFEEAE